MTRRLAGTVIGAQGLAVFFGALVARALASANGSDSSGTFLGFGSALAVLCILDAGLLRRPWGVTVGWALQIAVLASAIVVPTMLLVGVLFGALWLTALAQGRVMDEHISRVDDQWYAAQEAPGSPSPSPNLSGQSSVSPDPAETTIPAPDPSGPGSLSSDSTAQPSPPQDG